MIKMNTENTKADEIATQQSSEEKRGYQVTKGIFNHKIRSILNVVLLLLLITLGLLWASTNEQLQSAQSELNSVKSQLSITKSQLESTNEQLQSAQSELNSVKSQLSITKSQLESTKKRYEELRTKYGELGEEYKEFKSEAVSPPYTVVSGRNVTWAWKTSYGTLIRWSMPIDTYRYYTTMPQPKKYLYLKATTGESHQVMDFTPFVKGEMFSKVIPELYYQINDDRKFVYEVWYLVSQLTIYSSEIRETPRWAIETLTEAGGDCEDTAILVASMLKAAPKNYKVQLVYMDADNPTKPKTVNHVIVSVDTGTYKTFIETTSKTKMSPYTEIMGWFFEA